MNEFRESRNMGRSCGNFRPLNDIINGGSLPLYEQNATIHNCSDCAYFSSKNCGTELSDILETYDDLY